MQAGQLRIETRPCDAGQLVRDAAESLGPLAAEKGLWIEAKPCAPGIFVRCDGGRIQQVFSNLVGNAIKFSPRGTNVTVSAEALSDHVRFSVADAGPGVPTDQLGRIFERFWRREGREESHGLGLLHHQGDRRGPRRADLGRQHGRRREHVHVHDPAVK